MLAKALWQRLRIVMAMLAFVNSASDAIFTGGVLLDARHPLLAPPNRTPDLHRPKDPSVPGMLY